MNQQLSLFKNIQIKVFRHQKFFGPRFSYRRFLVAYGAKLRKFYFPYEFVTDLDKLNS